MSEMTPRRTKATTRPRKSRTTTTCAKCGSADVVPIIWGYPNSHDVEAAEQGKIALGGCVVSGSDPQRHCRACGEDFDFSRRRERRGHGNGKITP